ncbi:hypothetical protein HYS29_00150 [Candidatus Microgenomates bacterium]|nr:hypothetical protein [Candidatus Microgenomates bacterium]MBI2622357.1 hypothetical protein [Candidatus Microgenomates bacterium]
MKKFILLILFLFTVLFFSSSKVNAQTGADCSYKNYEWESYRCFEVFNSCQKACSDKAKGSYLDEVSPADKYNACMKASDCHGKTQACRDQAWADYQACKNADKNEEKTPKEAAKKETATDFVEFINGLPYILLNPKVETVKVTYLDSENNGQLKIATDNDDIPQDIKELFEKFKPMTDEEFKEIWNSRPNDLATDEDRIVEIGTGQDLKKGYWWSSDAGAVISSPSWEDIKFKEPIKNNNTQKILRMVELDQGQLEVKLKDPEPQNKFGVQGDFFDLFVIQTHFWISQSQDKKMAVIGVYEGEVEVKTKDGKTVKVKPNEGKPGVVVVSQKLSPVKLGVVGLVLVVIIGGVVLLLKKRGRKRK